MREAVTRALLAFYRLIYRTGLLKRAWFQRIFLRSYFLYKKHLEDPFDALIKAHPGLFKGGHILDIGANVGYTTSLFAKAADREFKVYSFEPDSSNFALLKHVVERRAGQEQITPVFAAVGSTDGTVELWHNQAHHGDHRIMTPTFEESRVKRQQVFTVPLISVDSFAKAEGIEESIKFIKIDVQGYELPVCQGMVRTLAKNPDLVIALEYAPNATRELGFEPDQLIAFFRDREYFIYPLERDGIGRLAHEHSLADRD